MNNSPFNKYDKIVDDITLLGYNVILRFNVILSKPLKDGKRYHFHQEYEYDSNKYIDNNRLVTLRRNFDYYLSIENIRENENGIKEFIQIRPKDMIGLLANLHRVSEWFNMNDVFAYNKENKLILYKHQNPIIIYLSMDKYIKFEPIIVKYTNIEKIGVRLYLSSEEHYADIDVDKFMEFMYFMNTFNMYQSAQLMINYLGMPDYGTNRHSFDYVNNYVTDEENNGFVSAPNNNRKIETNVKKKQKSFFDKIDELK